MAADTVNATQAQVFASIGGTSPDTDVTQAQVFAAAVEPSDTVNVSQVQVFAIENSNGHQLNVNQAQVFALVAGRTADPRVRAWTFTLDGHDFYILNVGTFETLVCDLSTGEWFTWGTGVDLTWKARIGINWQGSGRLPRDGGSNVLVGDDTFGTVYFLNPQSQRDSNSLDPEKSSTFQRRMIAQTVIDSGYSFPPCFGVQLFGSIADTDVNLTGADLDVKLEYSDDRGKSWVSAGTLTPPAEEYSFRLNWQSLGSMQAPGRLFRLTDVGALKRVDGFELEDGPEDV